MYRDVSKLPVLLEVHLQFQLRSFDSQLLIMALAALEIITHNKCSITKTKTSNVTLKFRKGSPIGCKVALRKFKALTFIIMLIDTFSLENKDCKLGIGPKGFCLEQHVSKVLNIPGLEGNYHFFRQLGNLRIKFLTTSKTKNELRYLLRSYKLKN